MRHDWNSLDTDGKQRTSALRELGIPRLNSRLTMYCSETCTDRVTARFPSADVLVDYMAVLAKPREQDGHISYSTDVRCAMLVLTCEHCAHPKMAASQSSARSGKRRQCLLGPGSSSAYADGETWYYDDSRRTALGPAYARARW